MADTTVLDPSPYGHIPQIDPSNPSFSDAFDSSQFPDDFAFDLPSDFDLQMDFSIEDLLDFPEMEEDLHADGGQLPSPPPFPNSGSQDGSGVSSSSQASGDRRPDLSGSLNMPSPDSGDSTTTSPESRSSAASAAGGDVKSEEEEEEEQRKGMALKRKKETEDGERNPHPNLNPNLRGSKEEEKKKARLMRNRESAQLSRQRKKHYVEELEDKIKLMHSTIADLNNKVSFFMAENASLRQQLAGRGGGGGCAPPTVYPPPPQMAPLHIPWIPCSNYALRPHGSQVPLIPIPRLKSQQPAPTPRVKKSEGKKKSATKGKKVASITLLGLLFFVLLVGSIGPGVNLSYGGSRETFSGGYGLAKGGVFGRLKGRVLNVGWKFRRSNLTDEIATCSGKMGIGNGALDWFTGKRCGRGIAVSEVKQMQQGSRASPGQGVASAGNSSEPLLASLYVPRNDKLVKIDGNLIIHSVLASERAMAHLASEEKSDKAKPSMGKEGKVTGLAVMSTALTLSRHGEDLERHPPMYGNSGKHEKALASGSQDTYKNNLKSTPFDGSRQWFHEGLEGPILSSGLCTEVFQFDSSPANVNSGVIIPTTSIANVTDRNSSRSSHRRRTNRRILHTQPIPLPGATADNLEGHFVDPSKNSSINSNKSVSSVVVSVLVDPRDAGEGMIAPNTISRFFVVVLLDGIKYVTYSCGLPLKSSTAHLVTR